MDGDEILYITPEHGVATGKKEEEEPVANSIESVDNSKDE